MARIEFFEINADSLINSLVAIAPHAAPDGDEIKHRIRLEVGRNELTLSAMSGPTLGILRVKLLDPIREIFTFDVPPKEAAHVCRLFKPAKDAPEVLRVERDLDTKKVSISEVGGLIPRGRDYSFPQLGEGEKFPEVGRAVAVYLTSPSTPRSVTEISGVALQAMASTAAALGERIVLEATSDQGPLVARIGERFIGLASAARNEGDEDHLRRLERTREEWLLRLPDPSRMPSPRAAEDAVQYAIPFSAAAAVQEVTPEMVAEAAEQVIATDNASTSLIQRKLRVGFSAAIRVMEDLESAGVVSEPDGEGRREVLTEPSDIDLVKAKITAGV